MGFQLQAGGKINKALFVFELLFCDESEGVGGDVEGLKVHSKHEQKSHSSDL